MIKRRRIRSLVLRNYISVSIVSLTLFVLMFVMFGFDLEDQIFDYQVTKAADDLVESEQLTHNTSGTVRSLEMLYFVGTSEMPPWMAEQVDPSWGDRNAEIFAEEKGHFHVANRTLPSGEKLYLLFNARAYIRSTQNIKAFLQGIGGLATIVFLASLIFVYRMTRKVSVPLEEMAAELADENHVVSRFDLPDQAPAELHALARAIEKRDLRIQALLERERAFNRDASHELRTPLAVAYGASEIIEETGVKGKAFTRLKAALKDMQLLTEGILWLGREPGKAKGCNISAACKDSIEAYKHLAGDREVVIQFDMEEAIYIPAPEPVAQVLVGNLLRNAISYTDKGEVCIKAQEGELLVIDTGVGFGAVDPEREGFGVGLSLVKRLCVHFNISFDLVAGETEGSVASLKWSHNTEAV
jgi:signal transduction histidine kinase